MLFGAVREHLSPSLPDPSTCGSAELILEWGVVLLFLYGITDLHRDLYSFVILKNSVILKTVNIILSHHRSCIVFSN